MKSSDNAGWVHSIPAIVGVALGTVYGLGAISIYGQLKGAGLNGLQSMETVPLEQVLSRGIGGAASAFGQAALYALLIAFIAVFTFLPVSEEPGSAPTEAPQRSRGRVARVYNWAVRDGKLSIAVIGLGLLMLLAGQPEREAEAYAITIALVLGSVAYMWKRTGQRKEYGVRRLVLVYGAGYTTFLIVLTVATAFLNPAPLPHVSLVTPHGVVEGGLVARSGESWYVAQENGSLMAIGARHVSRSFITYPERAAEQSVADWFLDRPPSTLSGRRRD